MDALTQHWTVPAKFQSELEDIRPIFRAVPLCVHMNDILVPPSELTKILANATIKIAFTTHHTYIKKKD